MRHLRLALVLVPFAVAGCANSILSDDRIRTNTASTLGVSPDQITISDRKYDGMTNTYYTASAAGRNYACTINGGTVMSMGITNPPTCTPK